MYHLKRQIYSIFQTKWLSGARAEYEFDENINLGFTVFHLNERPGGITRFSVEMNRLKIQNMVLILILIRKVN